ncbi:hypothetical protein NMY22_g7968 [Coprinellus aureogranulatus]|nr:hypothetical protein NMY22_g7968 [Coprinellus aureogranulatus]
MSVEVMSPFEIFLVTSDPGVVMYFMGYLDVSDIIMFGRLNLRIRFWYDIYRCQVWDMLRFVSEYVDRAGPLLSHMDGNNAMMYGEAILRFFLRYPPNKAALDICTTVSRFYEIQRDLFIRKNHFDPGMLWRLTGKPRCH